MVDSLWPSTSVIGSATDVTALIGEGRMRRLVAGIRIGPHSVTAKIGEGGMGQVWQATDTQLNRDVALKILPDAFSSDPDRLARFKREAQILASLNHPNIVQITPPAPCNGREPTS